MSSYPANPNRDLLLAAVKRLEPLLGQIVFVGGCATGLLITDPGAAPVRATIDVDAIVELTVIAGVESPGEMLADSSTRPRQKPRPVPATKNLNGATISPGYIELLKLEKHLQELGFRGSSEEGAPRCRWVSKDVTLDLMPTDPTILGFTNRWYQSAVESSERVRLEHYTIRVITGPYFLATKLEAFLGRGKGDYAMSHDLEDIITVLDGRPGLVKEIENEPTELRRFLATELRSLLKSSAFRDALPGHLLPDAASQQRLPIVIDRIQQIIGLS